MVYMSSNFYTLSLLGQSSVNSMNSLKRVFRNNLKILRAFQHLRI